MIDDSDENYDRTLNRVPQYYYGSFQMPNLNFTDELLTRSSNESQTLTADLQEKVGTNYDQITYFINFLSSFLLLLHQLSARNRTHINIFTLSNLTLIHKSLDTPCVYSSTNYK